MTSTSSVTGPCSFGDLLTHIGMGGFKGRVSNLCFWTKSSLMNIPVALESKSTVITRVLRDVTRVIWTFRLQDLGDCIARMSTSEGVTLAFSFVGEFEVRTSLNFESLYVQESDF